MAMAQDNGLNPILKIQVCDLEYIEPTVQKEKIVIKVLDTVTDAMDGKFKDNAHSDMVPAVNAMIRSALDYVHRFQSVDTFVEGENNYAITGEITELSTTSKREVTESKDSKGKVKHITKVRYDGNVSFTLTLTNLSNNKTVTANFDSSGYSDGDMSSANKALTNAINRMESWVYDYFNEMYPIEANILEISEVNKNKVKELYIDVGSNIGVYKGLHFDLFEVRVVAGREASKKIGRIKVEEVSGDDICLCKVTRGSKEIKEAVDEKKTLKAICEE